STRKSYLMGHPESLAVRSRGIFARHSAPVKCHRDYRLRKKKGRKGRNLPPWGGKPHERHGMALTGGAGVLLATLANHLHVGDGQVTVLIGIVHGLFLDLFLRAVSRGVVDRAGHGNRVADMLPQTNGIALNLPSVATGRGDLVLVLAVALGQTAGDFA